MVSVAARTHRIRHDTRVILFTMCLGVFIAQLDSQVVNLAIKQIGIDLGVGISQLQWVMDSYNLLYATLLLTGGTLGDLYGRVRIFALGIGLIVLGSIVCAIAPTGPVLIAGRALTGIGAALEVPTSLAILTVSYPDSKQRAGAIGVWASCNGLALAVAPTVGGLLVDVATWRSIFALVIPACAVAMVLAIRACRNRAMRTAAASIRPARRWRSWRSRLCPSSPSRARIGVGPRRSSSHWPLWSYARAHCSFIAKAAARTPWFRSMSSARANSAPPSPSPA